MGDERRTGQPVCLGGEVSVLPRRYRLLVELRLKHRSGCLISFPAKRWHVGILNEEDTHLFLS